VISLISMSARETETLSFANCVIHHNSESMGRIARKIAKYQLGKGKAIRATGNSHNRTAAQSG